MNLHSIALRNPVILWGKSTKSVLKKLKKWHIIGWKRKLMVDLRGCHDECATEAAIHLHGAMASG